MNLIELKSTREALRKSLHDLDRITPCCMSCVQFFDGTLCSKFNAEPPEEWKRGPVECEHWVHDGIPF